MVRPYCCSVQEVGTNHKHNHGEDSCSEVFSRLRTCQKVEELAENDIIRYIDTSKTKDTKWYQTCVYQYLHTSSPSMCQKHEHKLHNQLMELQNAEWRGLTNSSRLQAPATLTSVARGCGEAGRAGGACLLASTGRPASKLMHNTHTHSLALRLESRLS